MFFFRPLCENLCSLNPGEDRLAFSVEWTLDSSGKILKEWFGRTVIRSCAKLAYEHAQGMLDEPDRIWKEEEIPPVQDPWKSKDLSVRVNILQKIAVQLRRKREESGALRLDQPKLSFTFDTDKSIPIVSSIFKNCDSWRVRMRE